MVLNANRFEISTSNAVSMCKPEIRIVAAMNTTSANRFAEYANYSVGSNASWRINDKIGVRLGLGYTNYSGSFGIRTYHKVLYDFGTTLQTTNVSAYRLSFFEMPVSLYHSFGSDHQINLGLCTGVFIGGSEKVEIIKTGDINSIESYTRTGYSSAYKSLDFSLHYGYSYQINKNIHLNISGKIGLTDISKNSVFTSKSLNRINAISIGFGYRIL